MIFTAKQYEAILETVEYAIAQNQKLEPADAIRLGYDYDAVSSLYNQVFVRNLRVETKKINYSKIRGMVNRVAAGERLYDIAQEFHIGPLKIAKLYLEAVMDKSFQFSNILSDPSLIANKTLRDDIIRMIGDDPVTSYHIELTKQSLGREYEDLLVSILTQKKFCFETESDLRKMGKPKTPDILFSIPMATKRTLNCSSEHADNLSYEESDEVVINWIDSKAIFADDITFKEHLEQFREYNNRYGRGLVIYWHGYVESVQSLLSDDLILVRDHFPSFWLFPTGELADGRTPEFDQILL
jgi:hypothetical protein